MTILDAMTDPVLFGSVFGAGKNWTAWRAFLAACFAVPMTAEEVTLFRQYTARQTPPQVAVREAWLVVGRRGGKSRIAALAAVYLGCFRSYAEVLAPGERGTLPIIAADRRQARTVLRYVNGLLDSCPMLAQMVANRTAESIELTNGVTIEVHTASFRSIRGYTVVAAVLDEVAFWRAEDSANPDREIVNALRPAMATVPAALLLAISSPYARRGCLWDAYRHHYGKDGDPVLVWQAPTRAMNPTVPEHVVEQALAEDESAARAEYLAEFRRDIESFITREAVEAVIVPSRHELPPVAGVSYLGFIDPSGGSSDSMTLAVAHQEQRGDQAVVVLDVIREVKPPFSPDAVVRDFCDVLKAYRLSRASGDRYAGDWAREPFREQGIEYVPAEKTKSDLYAALLPGINSRRVELLDHPRLLTQLCGLERRTSWAGRDTIDHAPGGHDDLANAVAGAFLLCSIEVDRRFLRRTSLLKAIVKDGRRHPFSQFETTCRDDLEIISSHFDAVPARRAAHIALSHDQQAGALAIGYATAVDPSVAMEGAGLAYGRFGRKSAATTNAAPEAPWIVVEAVLRIVPESGSDVSLKEIVRLILDVGAEVPVRWVTTAAVFSMTVREMLTRRSVVCADLSAEQMLRGYDELRAAIYDQRLQTYNHPTLLAALATLEVDRESGRIDVPQIDAALSPMAGKELAEAVSGLTYILATRRVTWGPVRRTNVIRERVERVSVVRS